MDVDSVRPIFRMTDSIESKTRFYRISKTETVEWHISASEIMPIYMLG